MSEYYPDETVSVKVKDLEMLEAALESKDKYIDHLFYELWKHNEKKVNDLEHADRVVANLMRDFRRFS